MTLEISSLNPWDLGALLDGLVWVDTRLGRGDDGRERVRAFFAPPDAVASAPMFEGAELVPLWTALRSVPRGDDMIINPAGEGETLVRDADVDRVLGGDRSTASALSFRQRAVWGAKWVIVHVGQTGRLAGTIPGRAGRRAVPMWTDLESAEAALPVGARIVQSALIDLLSGGDEVDYAVDPQGSALYIDQTLRAELLETEPLFPKGYWAQLGILKPDDYAPFLAAAALAAAEARGAGRPFAGLWVVGYQLETAPARVVYVVDVDDLDAAAAIVVDAINRQEPQPERTETVRLRDLSPESQEFVRVSPDMAGS